MFYPQGTYFLRLHPLGNLYEEKFSARQDTAPFYRLAGRRLSGWGQESRTYLNK